MHGVAEATEHLADYCRQNSSIQVNQVFTPRCGDTVDSTGERYIYQVSDKERGLLLSSVSLHGNCCIIMISRRNWQASEA